MFLEDKEQQAHNPKGATMFLHSWLLGLDNSIVLLSQCCIRGGGGVVGWCNGAG